MASTAKYGHVINVSNFHKLIKYVIEYAEHYNPASTHLMPEQLHILASKAQQQLAEVIVKNTAHQNAINERKQAHKELELLFNRIINCFYLTEASAEKIADAVVLQRKMLGKKTQSGKTKNDPVTGLPKKFKSQQSYHHQLQHLANLIAILQSEPSYDVFENDLKLSTILAFQKSLIQKNTNVTLTYTELSNARIARNEILYAPDTGLIYRAAMVKKYIQALYGFTSPQYAQVRGIYFMKEKK